MFDKFDDTQLQETVSIVDYDLGVFLDGDTGLRFLDTNVAWSDHMQVNVFLHDLWTLLCSRSLEGLASRVASVFFAYNQRLAPGVMYRYMPGGSGRSVEAHLGAGYLGLWEAFAGTRPDQVGVVDDGTVAGWDPSSGAFSTYASRHIAGRVWRSFASSDEQYHSMSYGTFQKRPHVMKAYRELSVELGCRPSVRQLMARTGLSYDVVSASLSSSPLALDAPHGDDDSRSLHDAVADSVGVDDVSDVVFGDASVVGVVGDLLEDKGFSAGLSVEELLSAVSHFGVSGGVPQTLVGVGFMLGVPRKAVAGLDKSFKEKLAQKMLNQTV